MGGYALRTRGRMAATGVVTPRSAAAPASPFTLCSRFPLYTGRAFRLQLQLGEPALEGKRSGKVSRWGGKMKLRSVCAGGAGCMALPCLWQGFELCRFFVLAPVFL